MDRHQKSISWKRGVVDSLPFFERRDRKHLGGAQYLSESLVLAEVKRFALTLLSSMDRAAIGESEFIADEGWDPSRVSDCTSIEEIAGIQCGIPMELKD